MLIKTLYGGFPNPPDPLKYAFFGPLIGSASRVLFGFVADKVGGAILTTICGIALIAGTVAMIALGLFTPTSVDQFGMFVTLMLTLFFFTGMGNAATFRQFPIIFGHNPRQAACVIGWTAAIAAYGPFLFSILISTALSTTGSVTPFFIGLTIFLIFATFINGGFTRKKLVKDQVKYYVSQNSSHIRNHFCIRFVYLCTNPAGRCENKNQTAGNPGTNDPS